jgi:hypothetical protein
VNAESCFAPDYAGARAKFLEAAAAAGAHCQSVLNPSATGPGGEALYTDVAVLGAAGAANLLLLNSATHGVEGYCGSACQVAALAAGAHERLPADCAMVLSHALNPYGFAHDRRVNEGNIDLNRNFVDHRDPPADPEDYDLLHPHLVPEDWSGAARQESDAFLARYREERGMPAFQHNVMAGQYSHPDGLFYGGDAPSWSSLLWRRMVAEHCSAARRVAFIDFHTGLGPRGVGEAIFIGSDEHVLERAASWYGDVTSTGKGTSSSGQVRGDLARVFEDLGDHIEVTPIALEFGTVPLAEMIEAVRADNWLYARAGLQSPHAAAIKRQIRSAFYQEGKDWKSAVVTRALEIIEAASKGLRLE